MLFRSGEINILKDYFLNNMKSNHQRSSFTYEEDELIRNLVKKNGENWDFIANYFPEKNKRQCRERYNKYLKPNISNKDWTNEEEELLMQKYNEIGPKWVAISKYFEGRTDINVKNRWVVLMRKNKINLSSTNIKPQTQKKTRTAVLSTNFPKIQIDDEKMNYQDDLFNSESIMNIDEFLGENLKYSFSF